MELAVVRYGHCFPYSFVSPLTSGEPFSLQQKPQGLRGLGLDSRRAFQETYGLYSPTLRDHRIARFNRSVPSLPVLAVSREPRFIPPSS